MTRRSAATATAAVAAKATEAADTLMAWLQTQPRAADGMVPGDRAREGGDRAREGGATPAASDPAAAAATAVANAQSAPGAAVAPPTPAGTATPPAGAATPAPPPPSRARSPRSRARSPDPGRTDRHAPLRLAHTDWLYHRLQVTGPAATLVAFRAAAAGAGTVPWQLDIDRMAEDFFHLLVAPPARAGSLIPPPRSLSLAGARIVADQLCAAVARRQAMAAAQIGHSRACPFDLHALVPVPDAVLRRGPDDPLALDWLWAHWGTTQTLRHVAADAAEAAAQCARLPAGQAVWAVRFWSADWTPWRALARIAAAWPTLRFTTRPSYDPR
jgi:hypothetical protein